MTLHNGEPEPDRRRRRDGRGRGRGRVSSGLKRSLRTALMMRMSMRMTMMRVACGLCRPRPCSSRDRLCMRRRRRRTQHVEGRKRILRPGGRLLHSWSSGLVAFRAHLHGLRGLSSAAPDTDLSSFFSCLLSEGAQTRSIGPSIPFFLGDSFHSDRPTDRPNDCKILSSACGERKVGQFSTR